MTAKSESRFHQIIFGYLRGVWRDIALGVVCIVGVSTMALMAPWPLKLAIDHVMLDRPWPAALAPLAGLLPHGAGALAALAASLLGIAVLTGLFAFYQQFITTRIGYQIVYKLRCELFDHLQRLSLSFHNRAHTGELLNKVTSDTTMLKDVYTESLLQFSTHGLTLIGVFVVMLLLNWQLALVVTLTFPVLFWVLVAVLRKVRLAARKQRRNEGHVASRLGELLMSVSLVQAFGREDYERERFEQESAESMAQSIRTARMEAAATRLVEVVSAVGSAIVLLLGGMHVLRGTMTPGDLLVFVSYVGSIYRPVRSMARLSTRFSRAGVSAERIREIFDIEPEIRDAPDAIEAVALRGEIRFDNVTFGYAPGKPVLRGVSFTVPSGKRVALVGASGAGKSTIASLVLRLYDPQEGAVLVDGVDVRRYRCESLRREIGVVLQDTVLFGASIRENIAYGKPDASDEEIEQAAREVNAHSFIVTLPDGYEEELGEGGTTISGGQRQRICLARALIKRPAVLIMDEPTSAVDADSEALIRDALHHLQEGKTTLLIAHQLYSVRHADWILVLKDGRIVEEGTHSELVRRGGYYCELFRVGGIRGQEDREFSDVPGNGSASDNAVNRGSRAEGSC
jgi:ATP-binding cassette subfamily B protein/subfamily B ATP-binding cassette protein MsbA